jgi:anti-anti-sigma factor
MKVIPSQIGDVPLLCVMGDVDHETAPILRRSIDLALARDSPSLLLDLGPCPYLDSGGISVLLETERRMKPRGGWAW